MRRGESGTRCTTDRLRSLHPNPEFAVALNGLMHSTEAPGTRLFGLGAGGTLPLN